MKGLLSKRKATLLAFPNFRIFLLNQTLFDAIPNLLQNAFRNPFQIGQKTQATLLAFPNFASQLSDEQSSPFASPRGNSEVALTGLQPPLGRAETRTRGKTMTSPMRAATPVPHVSIYISFKCSLVCTEESFEGARRLHTHVILVHAREM